MARNTVRNPSSYDDIVRRTVVDPDSSVRPSREQEAAAREGFRALDADEQVLYDRVREALASLGNGASNVTALDSTCTHLGCRVSWDREREELRCPCHGGVYDRTGAVKAGPPPAPLATIATRIDGGQVLVRL